MADEPKYDVAISFLAKNEALAREITDKLAGLNVFFFPRQQEELAGTDGLDSMREPFLTARVAVVLYDTDWGKTKWTRVEETAIKDHCLNKGWDSLVFAPLSVKVGKPTWVPNTHIRFNLEDYPVEQLAGAIKVRVQEQGGSIKKPDDERRHARSTGAKIRRGPRAAVPGPRLD